jgi:glycosyltransferase involved in cell wall biosynthesis
VSGPAPLLSVLCLTYNHEAYVAEALESFLAQRTGFEIEVVVADDCSTDATLNVVENFRHRFGARLRVLRTDVNLGVTRNFRRALAACRGRYVALCEGDDHWRGQDKLQRQVDFLESHPGYVLAFHDAVIIGRTPHAGRVQLPQRRLRCDASRAALSATRPISTLTVCFRNVLGPLPSELDHAPALDLCLWSLLGQHGKGRFMSDIEPACYRMHEGGVFSSLGDRSRHIMTAQSLLALSRVYARTGEHALSERLLLQGAVMASRRMRAFTTLRLAGESLLWLLLRLLRTAWLAITRAEPR